MRRDLGIIFSFLLFQVPIFSVEVRDTFGVAGGLTSFNQLQSNAEGAIQTDSTSTLGMFAGVFGEMPLSKGLVFSPGVFLSQKGAENSIARLKVNYLETSAQLKWYFVDGFDFRMYLGGGFGFGILMAAETLQSNGTVTDQFSGLAKNELSGQGGLGLEFSLSKDTAMQLGFSYVRGLSSHTSNALISGKWEGFYAFTGFRFKGERESNTPEKRARDYVDFKFRNMRERVEDFRSEKEEDFVTEDSSLLEEFDEEVLQKREPSSQASASKRLENENPPKKEDDLWERDDEPAPLDWGEEW